MKKILYIFLSISFFACAMKAFAGGPLLTDSAGNPVVWQASVMPIPYTIDKGPLGVYTNSEAAGIVDDCFAVWQAVPTISLSLKNAGFLNEDVDSSNYEPYFQYTQGPNPYLYGINPVIFDSDGSIIDDLYGQNQSENIIGFSGSDPDTATESYYIEGLSLLNGRFTSAFDNWDPAGFKATFVHEFGHFIGLDHTQINGQFDHDDNTSNDIYIPTMYPYATDNDCSLARLNPDDEAAVTMLYPASDAIVNVAYGKIHGTLHWKSGLPARGANVVAVKQGSQYDQYMYRFSCVSDYAMMGDGSFDMWVTPGTYDFIVEPIDPYFTGGSSVGPYAGTALSRSFIFPAVTTEYKENLTIAAGDKKELTLTVRRNLLSPVPGLVALLKEFLYNLGL